MTLVYGADKDVSDWVSRQIFGVPGQFEKSKAIGVVENSKLIAGVVYNNQYSRPDGDPYMIEMSVASIDKKWATRHNLRVFFSIPFIQYKLERIQTHCKADDEGVIMFNKRLGFNPEGYHRQHWPSGGDSISWSMLRHECRWINGGLS